MTWMREPRGKLDATAQQTDTMAVDAGPLTLGGVNGPEGEDLDWLSIDWRVVEDDVRRLRQRIFTASRAGDLKRVRSLQRLMLRSRSNVLLSVRRVAQINAGRETAGVDGRTALLASQKADLADWVQHRSRLWTAKPVRRVYIPKAGGTKKRPLGIPVIADRALQAVTVNALEPEWEARFESRSYGFRPGRGCHDAIEAIYKVGRGPNPTRRWVLDADLAAAFDRIDHTHLLGQLGTFPARDRVAAWLRAGVVEKGWFTPTEEGTPQGGVISPVLLNVALHGMEQAAGAARYSTGSWAGWSVRGAPVLVRYADDLVALCVSREQADQVKQRLATWLAPRGLAFNEDKTRIVTLDDGFDFLGFTVRRFRGKLLIKPSTAAVRRIRERLTAEMRALRGASADAVLQRLNPIIRGWSAYYRTAVSSETFNALDAHMWRLAYKWARFRHPNKSKRWVTARYFGTFNTSRRDRWVFGDRESGAHLTKFAWTKIVRHQIVAGPASPDDPALAAYWAKRQQRRSPPLDQARLRLLLAQRGRCPACGGLLLHADREPQHPREWEQWIKATRTAIRKEAILETGHGTSHDTVALLHAHCRRRNLNAGSNTAPLPDREPSRLA